MRSMRNWPASHIDILLDFIDLYGPDTLVTAGPKRQAGYEKCQKFLNKTCTPRPRPLYSIRDVKDQCQYLMNNTACVVGPNLKGFFSKGRSYLRLPPDTIDVDSDNETSSLTTLSGITTLEEWLISETILIEDSPPARNDGTVSSDQTEIRESLTPNKEDETESISVTDPGFESPFLDFEEVFGLQSRKHRLHFQEIEGGFARLFNNANRAVDVHIKGRRVNKLPQPDFEFIARNHSQLARLLQAATNIQAWKKTKRGEVSNESLLRALIGWTVFNSVFLDPFPKFGTERGTAWRELEEVLQERGAGSVVPYLENLRADVQFRLAQKPNFLNETLPNRAATLAERLSELIEPLFRSEDFSGNHSLGLVNDNQCETSKEWIPKLKHTILDALCLVVELRQRENSTDFIWPGNDAIFNPKTMAAENNATKEDLEGKKVLLTLVPGALGRVVSKDGSECELEVYYKAKVFLDMNSS